MVPVSMRSWLTTLLEAEDIQQALEYAAWLAQEQVHLG